MNDVASDPILESIETYFGAINEMFETAKKLEAGIHTNLYRMSILISIIDAMAKVSHVSVINNRERFLKFIEDFCDWPDRNKISISHLYKFLTLTPSNLFSDLRGEVERLYFSWPENAIISIFQEPELDSLDSLSQNDWATFGSLNHQLSRTVLPDFRHVEIFYRLRNSVIHEMRTPGYGIELRDEGDEPYYHLMDQTLNVSLRGKDFIENLKKGTTTWELVYPFNFIKRLSENGAINLKYHCQSNRIPPHDSYTFGSYWIAPLND